MSLLLVLVSYGNVISENNLQRVFCGKTLRDEKFVKAWWWYKKVCNEWQVVHMELCYLFFHSAGSKLSNKFNKTKHTLVFTIICPNSTLLLQLCHTTVGIRMLLISHINSYYCQQLHYSSIHINMYYLMTHSAWCLGLQNFKCTYYSKTCVSWPSMVPCKLANLIKFAQK